MQGKRRKMWPNLVVIAHSNFHSVRFEVVTDKTIQDVGGTGHDTIRIGMWVPTFWKRLLPQNFWVVLE